MNYPKLLVVYLSFCVWGRSSVLNWIYPSCKICVNFSSWDPNHKYVCCKLKNLNVLKLSQYTDERKSSRVNVPRYCTYQFYLCHWIHILRADCQTQSNLTYGALRILYLLCPLWSLIKLCLILKTISLVLHVAQHFSAILYPV